MSFKDEWKLRFNTKAPEHKLTASMVLDWYKQDPTRCQAVIDELERLVKMGENAVYQNSVICKIWRGQRYEVTVCKDGYLYENNLYNSLTAVAYAITGAHHSGKSFFGLNKKKEEKASNE